jgi:NDP-sugar pyrophosphorylase family protein
MHRIIYKYGGLKRIKAVIFAGGYGTQISEETHLRPKPRVEIACKPIICHIMKLFSFYDIQDLIICFRRLISTNSYRRTT